MAGVTDLPFRLLCKKSGAGFMYTEMISAKGIFYNNENTKKLLELGGAKDETAVQIFGSEPDIMRYAAEFAASAGAAAIDINMGCPAPKIVKNGDGCALMAKPKLVGKIVNAAAKAVSIPVTIKIRKGISGNNINAAEIAEIAEYNGASAVCVHGRTLDSFYSGKADWDIIAKVKNSVSIPVFGNGDVDSLDTAYRMIAETGCDAVLIGRAACGNPWVFSGLSPSESEKRETAIAHAESLADFKGEYVGVREMRKHLGWYIKGTKNASKLKVLINKAESLREIEEIINAVIF